VRATHEHEWEAAPGLPEALPAGEKILWQGCPNWAALAVHAFHVRKVSFYFALMMAWQIVSLHADGVDPLETFFYLMRSLTLSITAVCMLCMAAWWSARTTLYTLTNKRLIMRVGIVLSLTFNLPLRRIRAADVHRLPRDHADIALQLPNDDRIGWFHLWPHQRAWHVRHPQPTLRCIPQGERVSELLLHTWRQLHQPHLEAAPSPSTSPTWQGQTA
jgi:hypothetical protein